MGSVTFVLFFFLRGLVGRRGLPAHVPLYVVGCTVICTHTSSTCTHNIFEPLSQAAVHLCWWLKITTQKVFYVYVVL